MDNMISIAINLKGRLIMRDSLKKKYKPLKTTKSPIYNIECLSKMFIIG